LYKSIRKEIHQSVRKPLTCPDVNQIGFSINTGTSHFISIFQEKMPKFSVPGYLKIPTVNNDKNYKLTILIKPSITHHLMKHQPAWMNVGEPEVNGEWLINKGVPMPVMDPETVLVFKLTCL
jgi:alpha-galactosidase